MGLTLYKLDQGSYPASLEALSQSPAEGQPPYLQGGLQDAWGHELRYLLEDGTFRLWSVGPDGVDNSGKGDDILVR